MKTLLPIATAFAVCLWLAVSTPPAGHASSQADCSLTSTGMLPLTDMGLHRYRGVPLFVSRGIGYSGLNLRLHCPAEVALLTLRATAAGARAA